jgi:small subunit ribosomal protein S14
MAKESMKAREVKRAKLVARYAAKRKALKEAGDYAGLDKLPKNASPVRMHNRCKITGRPKGYIRQFGISRVLFRKMALEGKIPGVTKASW